MNGFGRRSRSNQAPDTDCQCRRGALTTAPFRRMLAVIACLGLWSASIVNAAGPVDCGDRPIRLAFYDYGYLYFEDQGQAHGIDKDLADELARRSGCRFDSQVMKRARIWADLESGDLDMGLSGIQTEQRDRFAWFVPYLAMKNYAILHGSISPPVRSGDDFVARGELQFGVVRGFKHGAAQERWLQALRDAGRVQESADVETIFKKLQQHRVDAMFSQPPVYLKKLADFGMEQAVVIVDWTPREQGVAHGLVLAKTRFSDRDAAQWRGLIDTLRQDGTLARIYARYLPDAIVSRMLDF